MGHGHFARPSGRDRARLDRLPVLCITFESRTIWEMACSCALTTRGSVCSVSSGPTGNPKSKASSRACSWVREYKSWLLPGLEYHNRLFANGRTVWSLELSLVLLVCVLLTIMAILWRVRLGGWLPRKKVNEH